MASRGKKTTAGHDGKRRKFDSYQFWFTKVFNNSYEPIFKKAKILQEREFNLQDLEDTFILSRFEGRGWDKLLRDFPSVNEHLIQEFYTNALVREGYLECWVHRAQFNIGPDELDMVLGIENRDHSKFMPYQDREFPLETLLQFFDAPRDRRSLKATEFCANMRGLEQIMLLNL